MYKLLKILIFIMLSSTAVSAEKADLIIINIDNIGSNLVTEIKNNKDFDWWVEMGDKMVVAINSNALNKLPKHINVINKLENADIENLAFQALGHCDHSGTDENLHHDLDVVFSNNSSQIINIKNITDKNKLFDHDSIIPFTKNKVLAYQYNNREHQDKVNKGTQVQVLIDAVDKDRWLTQVEYLSSLNRMLHNDLVIAGEWLETKFTDLGLTTSRVALHNHRGFNVLAFKQGTITPDNWYVVGAHLDSRNQNWNDTQPSPGAEDNASGCSGVLEIANVLSQYETESSIFFMCFIAEENGLYGSGDVVSQFTADGNIDKVKTMFNLDMISYRLGNRNIAIAGTNTNLYQGLANNVAANGNLYTDIDWQINLGMCCTDFLRFSNAGIPAVTSNQPDIGTYFGYHSVDDLSENLDPVLASGIIKANIATLADLVGVIYGPEDLIFMNGFE